jgi:hypothetical protein
MPSRKLMTSVLSGFLGTYVSRYSDLDGYLLFGLATDSLDELEVDLTGDSPRASFDPVSEVRRLAIRRFQEQLANHGLLLTAVRTATLTIRRGPTRQAPLYVASGPMDVSGYDFTFTAKVVTDLGRAYQARRHAFIAPHDPERFLRSARRGCA